MEHFEDAKTYFVNLAIPVNGERISFLQQEQSEILQHCEHPRLNEEHNLISFRLTVNDSFSHRREILMGTKKTVRLQLTLLRMCSRSQISGARKVALPRCPVWDSTSKVLTFFSTKSHPIKYEVAVWGFVAN